MTAPRNTELAKKRRDTTPKKKTGTSKGDLTTALRAMPTAKYEFAEAVNPGKPLTEKQKLFVRYWASGESIHTASARAGYADGGTIAYRLVRMPNVLKLYNEERVRYEAASGMSFKKVVDMHMEAFEMAKLMAEPGAMVAAAREVGKMHGYYAPVEKKITITGNKMLDRLNALSDAELIAMAEEGEAIPLIEQVEDETETED